MKDVLRMSPEELRVAVAVQRTAKWYCAEASHYLFWTGEVDAEFTFHSVKPQPDGIPEGDCYISENIPKYSTDMQAASAIEFLMLQSGLSEAYLDNMLMIKGIQIRQYHDVLSISANELNRLLSRSATDICGAYLMTVDPDHYTCRY